MGEDEGYYGPMVDDYERRIAVLEAALREIEKGEGPFSRDPLTFATNCIESMKELARTALGPVT